MAPGDQRRGRLAQQPLDVRDPEEPAGRRLQRLAADVDQRGQRGGELGVAHVGQRVGDGRVRAEDHRLRRHHRAGGVLGVRHQPAHVLGLVGLHQLEQRRGGLGRQVGDQVGGVVGRHLLEHVGGALGVEVVEDLDLVLLRAAPRGRRRAARRRARRPRRCAARRGRSWITLAASAGRISFSAAIRWVAPCDSSRRVSPSTSRHSTTWVWPRRRRPLAGSWTATRLSTQSRLRACSMPTSYTVPVTPVLGTRDRAVEHLAHHEGLGGALLEAAHVEQPGRVDLPAVDVGHPGHRHEDPAPAEDLGHQAEHPGLAGLRAQRHDEVAHLADLVAHGVEDRQPDEAGGVDARRGGAHGAPRYRDARRSTRRLGRGRRRRRPVGAAVGVRSASGRPRPRLVGKITLGWCRARSSTY